MAQSGLAGIVMAGDRGIGAEVASGLLAGGARVVITPPPGQSLGKDAPAPSDSVRHVDRDVSTAAGAEDAVRVALDAFGTLDLVVVNPMQRVWPSADTTAEVERCIQRDLRSAYTLLKSSTIAFRQQRSGRAILLIPEEGLTGSAQYPVQAAVAGGLVGLTKAVSLGMSRYGVPCNGVAFDPDDKRPESIATLRALCEYLAVADPATTGHIFGASGTSVSIWSHERPIASIFDASGKWSIDDLAAEAPARLSIDPLRRLAAAQ